MQVWLGKAAAANPVYALTVELPAVLPPWVARMPCPLAHLPALRQAVTRLKDYTEGLLPGLQPGRERMHALNVVTEGLAAAGSTADYANRMWGAASTPPRAAHEGIELRLKDAAESHFYIGQVLAMPGLADAPRRPRTPTSDQGGPHFFPDTAGGDYPQTAQRRESGGSQC